MPKDVYVWVYQHEGKNVGDEERRDEIIEKAFCREAYQQ